MRTYQEIHKDFCDYEVAKAKSTRFFPVLNTNKKRKTKGIRTANVSKAVLAMELAKMY